MASMLEVVFEIGPYFGAISLLELEDEGLYDLTGRAEVGMAIVQLELIGGDLSPATTIRGDEDGLFEPIADGYAKGAGVSVEGSTYSARNPRCEAEPSEPVTRGELDEPRVACPTLSPDRSAVDLCLLRSVYDDEPIEAIV